MLFSLLKRKVLIFTNYLISAPKQNNNFDNKFTNIVTLTGLLINIVGIFINLAVGSPIELNIVIFVFTISCSVAYYLSRFKYLHKKLSPYILGSIMVVLLLNWVFGGGTIGTTLIYYPFAVVLGMLILHNKHHLLFIIILIAQILVLFTLENALPQIITPYKNEESLKLDLVSSSILSVILFGILIHYFKKTYDYEQLKLRRSNFSLRKIQVNLTEAKQVAESATIAKTHFLANMSHEIRTPLNGIVGSGELLSLTQLTDEQKKYVEALKTSGNHLLSVINDVLDLSKIEADKLEMQMVSVDLKKCLQDVITITTPTISKLGKNIDLNFYYDDGLPKYIKGDESRLKQILVNLIGNAIKFTEEGSVKLDVTTMHTPKSSQILFQVSDSGIGIKREDLSKLFQPFSQVDGTTTRNYGGTGLGLSICKKLVEMMGGSIWASSEYQKGSMFSFCVPLIAANSKEVEITSQPQPIKQFQDLYVLVAEDNLMNQFIASNILSNMSVTADIADNGKIAVEKAIQNNYDIIFMDMQMPEMDGVTASVKIIEAFKEKQLVPPVIIAITANAMPEDKQKCIDAGMKDFVSKPFTIEQLTEVINKWC